MKLRKVISILSLAALLLAVPAMANAATTAAPKGKPGTFTVGKGTFLLNGEPFIVRLPKSTTPASLVPTGSIASRCVRRWA